MKFDHSRTEGIVEHFLDFRFSGVVDNCPLEIRYWGEKYCVYPTQQQVGNAWCFFIDINVDALCCSSMACFISK